MRGQKLQVKKPVKWLLITALVSAIIYDQILPRLKFPAESLTHNFFDYLSKTSLTFAFIVLIVWGFTYFIGKYFSDFTQRCYEYEISKEVPKKEKKTLTKSTGGK